jgi:ParB family chromosome partitioning protein
MEDVLMLKESNESIPTVRVDSLIPDPNQPRSQITEQSIEMLANSISETGKLLYPILYREVVGIEGVKRIIVDGERRWRAYQKLGLDEIPAMKFEGDYEAVAIIGNITREEFTAMDEALAVNKLKLKLREADKDNKIKPKDKVTNVKLGKMLGRAESTISEVLKLIKLPGYIQAVAKENKKWSRAKLLKIAKKRTESAQKALFDRMSKEIELGKRERITKEKIEAAKNQIELFKSKMTKIETAWTPDDKKALKHLLRDLFNVIAKML